MYDQANSLLPKCATCGRPFVPSKPGRRFCGQPCYHASRVGLELPLTERFWRHVIKGDEPDACWTWNGANDGDTGYGRLVKARSEGRGQFETHRLAYTLASGEMLTEDDVIGHICDNPPCVRSDTPGWYKVGGVLLPRWGHLFRGTAAHNNRDASQKGRASSGARHSAIMTRVHVRGGGVRSAKLTADDVLAIRSAYANGARQIDLASRYGVGQTLISKVVRRTVWAHI